MPFIESQSTDALTHNTAIRLARQCRNIIQACLREEEWIEADREFYRIIRAGLEEFRDGQLKNGKLAPPLPPCDE
jgi:hypothetical protein